MQDPQKHTLDKNLQHKLMSSRRYTCQSRFQCLQGMTRRRFRWRSQVSMVREIIILNCSLARRIQSSHPSLLRRDRPLQRSFTKKLESSQEKKREQVWSVVKASVDLKVHKGTIRIQMMTILLEMTQRRLVIMQISCQKSS